MSSEDIPVVLGTKVSTDTDVETAKSAEETRKPQTGHSPYENIVDDLAFQVHIGLELIVWKIIKLSAYFLSYRKIEDININQDIVEG